jgi:hypothetical protein
MNYLVLVYLKRSRTNFTAIARRFLSRCAAIAHRLQSTCNHGAHLIDTLNHYHNHHYHYHHHSSTEVFRGRPAARDSQGNEVDSFTDQDVIDAMRQSRNRTDCFTADIKTQDTQAHAQQQRSTPTLQHPNPLWPEDVQTSLGDSGAWRHHTEDTMPKMTAKQRRELEVAEWSALLGDSTVCADVLLYSC